MATTVPRGVLELMVACGAAVRYIEGLVCVYCSADDQAYSALGSWATSLSGDKDPGLSAVVLPQPPATPLPPFPQQLMCAAEANSIIVQYSGFLAADFAATAPAHPQISGFAGAAVQIPARFSNAAMATHAVVERIADPALGSIVPGGFPTISAQPRGTYLCSLMQAWKGRHIYIHIHRK